MNTIKAAKDLLSMVFVIAAFVISVTATMYGCSSEDKPEYYYKIYKSNGENNYTMWTVKSTPNLRDGFVCWTNDNGGNFCISGNITIVPIRYSITVNEEGIYDEREEK